MQTINEIPQQQEQQAQLSHGVARWCRKSSIFPNLRVFGTPPPIGSYPFEVHDTFGIRKLETVTMTIMSR